MSDFWGKKNEEVAKIRRIMETNPNKSSMDELKHWINTLINYIDHTHEDLEEICESIRIMEGR